MSATTALAPRRGRLILVAVALTAGLLAGCGASAGSPPAAAAPSATPTSTQSAPAAPTVPLTELDLLAHPGTDVGHTTAVLASAAVTPVTTSPEQQLPTTATSHDRDGDVQVEVTDTSRIVAIDISGSLAATVWGLGFGESLVGRDVSTTFPGTEDLPVVTVDGHSVNAESILDLNPTLVISDGSVGPRDVVEQLRDAGIAVVFVTNDPSFDGAQELAREVAAALGAPAAGELLAAQIAAEVAATTAEIAAIAPPEGERLRMVFLYLRGTAGVYYLFGGGSGADDLITSLGGVDVAGEIGWEGMKPLTDEAMVAANPDLILVMTHGIESTGGVDGLLAAKPSIALTTAGINRRFVDMADGDVLSFGPRSARVLDALARAVYTQP